MVLIETLRRRLHPAVPLAMQVRLPEYQPRNPADSLLYSVVAAELETFLADQREREHEVPQFVEQEFRAFLDCGVLAQRSRPCPVRFLRLGSSCRLLLQATSLPRFCGTWNARV